MRKRKKVSLEDKLRKIDGELNEVASILEVIKGFCKANDYISLEITLDIALKRQYDLAEYISLMY